MTDEARKVSMRRRYGQLTFWNKAGFLGSMASIVAIPLALYFYLASVRTRELSWTVQMVRTIIFDPLDTTTFSVVHNEAVIKQRVMAVQVAIWNNGAEPIHQDDILEPIYLLLDPPGEVLEARTRETAREVSRFDIGKEGWKEGKVPLSWKILERGDGAVVQIIYTAEKGVDIRLKGTVEGQRSLRNSNLTGIPLIGASRRTNAILAIPSAALVVIVMLGMSASFFLDNENRLIRRSRGRFWFVIVIWAVSMCVWVLVIYVLIAPQLEAHPFDI